MSRPDSAALIRSLALRGRQQAGRFRRTARTSRSVFQSCGSRISINRCLCFDSVESDRVPSKLSRGMHLEFPHQVLAMTFDRTIADDQHLSDLLSGLTSSDQR